MVPVVLKLRIQGLFDMMKVNTSIHTMHLDREFIGNDVYRESIIPSLETNRFRLHVRAITETRPIAFRAKVLGRALLAARTDANRFWMLLSGNAEVAFPPTTATTTTTAADTTDVAPTVATTAAPAPIASGGQKRNACPCIAIDWLGLF
jgi:hypothetical protein